MTPSLQELKNKQLVWFASQQKQKINQYLSTGYSVLDDALQGGWPASGVVEVNPESLGIGELRLLLPVFERLASAKPLQAWINPPACLTPHNLGATSLARTVVISCAQEKQQCWAFEQMLGSGCCSSLVFWTDSLSATQAKRLQLAAKDGGTLAFIISMAQRQNQSLPLSLRMSLNAHSQGLSIDIFKRQNAWPVAPFTLDLSLSWPQLFRRAKRFSEAPNPDNVLPFPGRV